MSNPNRNKDWASRLGTIGKAVPQVLSLPQPYAWPSAVFLHEDYTSGLESSSHSK